MPEEPNTHIETAEIAGKTTGAVASDAFNAKKAIIAGSAFLSMIGVLFGISVLKSSKAVKKPNADEAQIQEKEAQKKGELKTKVDNLEQAPLGGDGQFDEQGNFVGPKVPNVELPEDKRTGERKGGRGTPETEIGKLALEPQNGAEAPYTAFSGKYQPRPEGTSRYGDSDPSIMREARAATKEERDLLASSMLGYSRSSALTPAHGGPQGSQKAARTTEDRPLTPGELLAMTPMGGPGKAPERQGGAESEYIAPLPGSGRSFTRPGELADMRITGGDYAKVPEGKSLECVTVNQVLAQAHQSPVILTVSRNFYTSDGRLLVPAGARILGISDRIEDMNQERMFMAFNRVDFPDGETAWFPEHRMPEALNPIGSLGVEGKVSRGIFRALMSSIALGIVEGMGAAATGPMTISTTTGITEVKPGQQAVAKVSNQLDKFSERVLNRYMNMVPKIVLKPGTRVRIYLSEDTLMSVYQGESQ